MVQHIASGNGWKTQAVHKSKIQGSQNVSEKKANHQEEAAGKDIYKCARVLAQAS